MNTCCFWRKLYKFETQNRLFQSDCVQLCPIIYVMRCYIEWLPCKTCFRSPLGLSGLVTTANAIDRRVKPCKTGDLCLQSFSQLMMRNLCRVFISPSLGNWILLVLFTVTQFFSFSATITLISNLFQLKRYLRG